MSFHLMGALIMTSFLGQALTTLFRENADIIDNARALGGVAACRIHRRETATNLYTGERSYRWQIEFGTQEDADAFDAAVRGIVEAVTEE